MSKYIVCMKNLRDSSWINNLGKQLKQGRKYELLENAYRDCCNASYGHLFIDLSNEQTQNDCRIR